MSDSTSGDAHAQTRAAWNANAGYWDERMGEGNAFFNVLLWPALERLLAVQPGAHLLDIACGNGIGARRLAGLGATVVAADFAEALLERARQRTDPTAPIAYHLVDATDEAALRALGEPASFDAALANMALFDMAEIAPLFRALARLLRPAGCFVFSLMHPAFNNPFCSHLAEQEDQDGSPVTTYAIKVSRYLTATPRQGLALRGQPTPHWYFHRPLEQTLAAGFAAGFVLDGLEERAFPPSPTPGNALGWNGNFSEFPPVLIARMRLPDGR